MLDIAGYPREGFKLGDFAGAISIIAPLDKMEQNLQHLLYGRLLAVLILWLTLTYCVLRRRFVQPLEHLTLLAAKIGRGEWSLPEDNQLNSQEMQTLYESFQTMSAKLQELHNNLENRVALRTSELAQAYQILQEQQYKLQAINMQLAKANEIKTEFIATMSHELQTPLTAMIASAEVILEQGTAEAQTSEYIYDIYQSAHHLLDLITDILDLARMEKGKMHLHTTFFAIEELVTVLAQIFHPLLQRSQLSLKLEISEILPMLQADKNKVKQILMNLMANAVKFTPAGGSITLKIGYLPDEQSLLIAVQDTGKGIPAADFSLIFEKFQRLQDKTAKPASVNQKEGTSYDAKNTDCG